MIQWYYLVLISSVLMGAATLLEKRSLYHEYASAFSSDFAIVAAVMSLFLLPFARLSASLQSIALIYVFSLLATATYLLTARTYRHGNVSIGASIYSTLPVFVTVALALPLLGERLTYVQYLSIAVMLAAAYLLVFTRPKGAKKYFEKRRYIYVMLVNAAVMGINAVLLKYIIGSVDPLTVLILSQVFTAINFTVYMQIRYGGVREIIKNFSKNRRVITYQAALTTAYRATNYVAIGIAAISLVSPLRNTLYVVITIIGGGVVFKETNIARKLAIALVMIAAAFFLVY